MPRVFRLVPSDTDQARAICQQIYAQLGLQKVLLIAQTDHDGRIGGAEFEKAAREFGTTPPECLGIADAAPNLDSIMGVIQTKSPEAIVLWTSAWLVAELLPLIRKTQPTASVFLCSKAAQMGIESEKATLRLSPPRNCKAMARSLQLFRQTIGRTPLEASSNNSTQLKRARLLELPPVKSTRLFI